MGFAIAGVLGACLLLGGTTIQAGVATGVIVTLGLAVMYMGAWDWAKSGIIRTRYLWDLGITFGTYVFNPSPAITSILGAAVTGVLVSFLLHHQTTRMSGKSVIQNDAQALLRTLSTP